ncbi:hypothetical protein B4N89_36160 [Embleya scabrispora]|uniref:Uncharacterized protein n=1 Tax=Embleya scabrispora TaxID=159449 RepID=A0A1T3NM44_9ACTN|nr:hypothetical protein B4N89_36160 [Embleya scabrispora]
MADILIRIGRVVQTGPPIGHDGGSFARAGDGTGAEPDRCLSAADAPRPADLRRGRRGQRVGACGTYDAGTCPSGGAVGGSGRRGSLAAMGRTAMSADASG